MNSRKEKMMMMMEMMTRRVEQKYVRREVALYHIN